MSTTAGKIFLLKSITNKIFLMINIFSSHGLSSSNNNQSLCQASTSQSHHFDNPVYATCRASDQRHVSSLNNTRLHNTIVKNINQSREKSLTLPASRRCVDMATTCANGEEDDISGLARLDRDHHRTPFQLGASQAQGAD